MSESNSKDGRDKTTETKAVAIKRDQTEQAPRITAKGSGLDAEKILDIAFAEGVKVRQDEGLTNLLEAFEVESPIPLEALHAVSLILERVYAENRSMEDLERATSNKDTIETTPVVEPIPKGRTAQGDNNS